MTLKDFNNLEKQNAIEELMKCCGATNWVEKMIQDMPYSSTDELFAEANKHWYETGGQEDWLEAFTQHPVIGDIKSLEKKFASTKDLAKGEQAGIQIAQKETLQELAEINTAYYNKFGFIFIVCATGKTAGEMLRLLKDRITNSYEEELLIARGEQQKITFIRLQKLLNNASFSLPPSQLTTHVLDTSIGKPGKNITIKIQASINNHWTTIAQGVTNEDGRISDLLPGGRILKTGTYKIIFETGNYFDSIGQEGFYPQVTVYFSVKDNSHYHVPLLINPFGYSTYRGS